MHRRSVIKKLGLFTGGMVLLPSCTFTKEQVDVAIGDMGFTESLKEFLGIVVEYMIPTADISESSELKLSEFVIVMANDCLSAEENKSYVKGMSDLEIKSKENHNASFEKLSKNDQNKMIKELLENESSVDSAFFINKTKQYAILGYMQSELVMTQEMPYKLIPGSYENCATIDPSQKININA